MFVRKFCVYSFLAVLSVSSLCCGAANVLSNPGFENVNDANWVRRGCTFTYTTEQKHSGSYSGKATARTANWQGIQQSLLGKLIDGNSCTISGWVKLENLASTTASISIEKSVNGTTSYESVAYQVPVNNTGWTRLSGNYTLHAAGNLTVLNVYFELADATAGFYVDDANVAVEGYIPPIPVDNSIKAQPCWTQTDSGNAGKADYAQDIAADSSGNVYVTGYSKNTNTSYDFVTIKYSPDGNNVWTRTYNRPVSGVDYALALAVDANSDIVSAGCSYLQSDFDGTIVKYTSAGGLLWAKTYNYSGQNDEIFFDVATDSGKNIYAVGETDDDCLIVKFSPQGDVLWAKTYNGSANGYDTLYKLALDSAGNIYACGQSAVSGKGQDCLVLKYSPSGNLLWSKTYNGPVNGWDLLESIVVDSAGNAYAAGSIQTASDSDYITMKYSPSGTLLWASPYTGTASGWDESYAIILAPDGNAAVTGYSQGLTSADAATIKYNSQTGAQIWAARYNGKADSTDCAEAIAADTRGNIYVLGRCTEVNNLDYLLVCYDNNGEQLSAMNYDGPAWQTDVGTAITAYQKEVYITGNSAGLKGDQDIRTIKPYFTCKVDPAIHYQTLDGIGAGGGWDQNYLLYHPLKDTLYDLLFNQLGLDIYRVRNTYQIDSGYLSESAQIVTEARAQTGRPLKIMLCSWSPPAELKSNNSTLGGGNATLARTQYGYYRYNDFAQWWIDSLDAWAAAGVVADYVSMQNEPDFDAVWDSCRFDATENSRVAGFNLAFDALANKVANMPNPPKLIVPDTAGFALASSPSVLADYLVAINNTDAVYGYCHHLYNGGGNEDNPDGFIPAMTIFAAAFYDKPRFQTEFAKDDNVTLTFNDAMNLAIVMHNSLVIEQVSSYTYWELFWTAPKGLVGLFDLGSAEYIINPVYYAFKHYSAFTDPGWQRIDAVTDSSVLRISSFVSPDNSKMSIIIVNPGFKFMTLDMKSLGDFNNVTGDVYQTTADKNCQFTGQVSKDEFLFIPEKSITTISFPTTMAACVDPPAGDLNGDCKVDFFDINELGAGFTGSKANILTLKNIAESWLECGFDNQSACWQ